MRLFEVVLERLDNVTRGQTGCTARCPAHDDHSNSLSIAEGDDSRVLLHCFAGCTVEQIVLAIGLSMRDLFAVSGKAHKGLSVDDLAADKGLPVAFLRSLGLQDRGDGVVIPYRLRDGSPASRHRLRTALRAKDGSLWLLGRGKPVPYGLDRLDAASEAGYCVLVEGESDCWTLWHHGFPGLGLPGSDMTGKLEAEHVDCIRRLYVMREPDGGGARFVDGIASRLSRLGWKGGLFVVALKNAKDPNELHQHEPSGFRAKFEEALEEATLFVAEEPPESPPDLPASGGVDGLLERANVTRLTEKSSPEEIQGALRDLAAVVSGTDALNSAMARESAARCLRGIGIRAPARLVDAAFGVQRSMDPDPLSGQGLALEDPEAWPEPVDGALLLDQLARVFKRYLVLPPWVEVAAALWTLHCYLITVLWISPFLLITSPQKRCGKSTFLILLKALVARGLLASNISPSAVFRSIDKFKPTLLIDEADTSLVGNDELAGVLNGGHCRDTARVVRSVGDQHEPRIFSTWCPKAIAVIGRLRDTLEDRSITVELKRKASSERVERLPRKRLNDDLEPLRRQAVRWAADHDEEIRDADPALPAIPNDRAQDNWAPLLAIADAAGGEWPDRARQAALTLSGSDLDDGSAGTQLLADLQELFRARNVDRLISAEIVEALVAMEERPWPEWSRGRPLTAAAMAKLLQPFGIRPRTIRTLDKTAKGYLKEAFEDTWNRYLPSEPSHRNNGEISGLLAEPQPSHDGPCDGPPNGEKERNDGLVTDVTDADASPGPKDDRDEPREEFEL